MYSKLFIFLLFIGIGSINCSIVKIESVGSLDNLIELNGNDGERIPHIDIKQLEFVKSKKVKIGDNEFDQLTCSDYKIDGNLCSKYEADKIICTNLNYKKEKWHKFNCEITEAKLKNKNILIKNQFISCKAIEGEHIIYPCVLRYYLLESPEFNEKDDY